MTDSGLRIRRRGVRASRIKLTKALADAGLKTQAGLAERIADLEGLDAAPRDVVNRVFREQAVDAATLERVARALGVEAFTLYLTANDVGQESGSANAVTQAPIDTTSTPAEVSAEVGLRPVDAESASVPAASYVRSRRSFRSILPTAAAALAAIAIAWAWRGPDANPPVSLATTGSDVQQHFGRFRVAVAAFDGDEDGELAVAVRERLERTLGVASAGLPLIVNTTDRAEIAARFRTDLVLDGEIVNVGQWVGVRAYAYVESRGRREQIWAESFQRSAAARSTGLAADHITAAVHRLLGLPAGDSRNPPHFPLAAVQDEYLSGRLYLDKAPSEINLRRAQGNFESALRHDANYAAAHAGLCEAALDAVWIESERRRLADAEKSCARALQMEPGDPDARRANAYFLSRSGRAGEAIAIYRQLVAAAPDDMESMLGLASAEFAQYQRTGEATWREPALAHARRATDITPNFWKPWMWLGVYEHGAGSVDRAIVALERAAQLDEGNEYVVANLGTMYFCRGDLELARDLYLRAHKAAPANYAGTEMLGMLYYFLGDFRESARLRTAAIDTARGSGSAEIHQMWGGLGDSWRQSGERERAIEAYARATEIIERDFLMGNATTGDRATRAYYYMTLLELDQRRAPAAILKSLDRDLEEALASSTESYALLRVAQTSVLRKNEVQARAALAKAMSRCECYERYPDLAPLVGLPVNRLTGQTVQTDFSDQ